MTAPETKREEFGATETSAMVETASSAVAAQAQASVQARYVMALQRPRDWDQVRVQLLKECRRPGFAEVAIYRKPIGKGVTGPSIRFAETAMRCMTNVMAECVTVYDDPQKRIVRVSVTDLESNLTYPKDVVIQKTVERSKLAKGQTPLSSRYNSSDQIVYTVWATDDDILNKENALVSKAMRTSGLRLIPGDLMDECAKVIAETKRKRVTDDPDAARKGVVDAFQSLGVSPADLKRYTRQDLDTLSPAQIEELRDLYNAMRDGETNWREVMDAVAPADGGEEGDKKARERQEKLRETLNASREKRTQGKGNGDAAATSDPTQPMVQEAITKRAAMFENRDAAAIEIRKATYHECGDLSNLTGQAIAKAVTFAQNYTPDEKLSGGLKKKGGRDA